MGFEQLSATKVVPFGKHKGKTFKDVYSADQGYCQWVLKLQDASGAMQEFIDYVRSCQGESASQGQTAPSQGFARSYSGPGSDAPRTAAPAAGGLTLGDSMTFVCELLPHDLFLVRVEAYDPNGKQGWTISSPLWQALSRLPEAKLNQSRNAFTFPIARYREVFSELEAMGRVEGIPQWVVRMADACKPSAGDHLREDRMPQGLLPYQLEGVKFGMSRRGRCLIGDEMGLGKTLQALALAAQYQEDWPVLVACPATLRWVWKEQALQWLGQWVTEDDIQIVKKGTEALRKDAKFWVLSYSLIASDLKKNPSLYQRRPDNSAHAFVICDESHNIKEWSAERTKALVPILKASRRALLLSGTPTRNAAHELHPQLLGLLPNCPVKMVEFRNRYCLQRERKLYGGRSILQTVGSRNGNELNHLLTSTVMIRRLKRDVLTQLPDKRRKKVPIEIADSKALKELRKMGFTCQEDGVVNSDVQSAWEEIGLKKLNAVKEHLLEVLDGSNEKLIVFAHHRKVMESLAEVLEARLGKDGQSFVRIDGSTNVDKRPGLVEAFQKNDNCRVALLSITAAGEGVTLTAAGLVIFAELHWVPGAVEQAEARAHRLGSKHSKVIIEFLVVPNSPEESIYNTLERKVKQTSAVLNGVEESMGAQECLSRKRQADSERLQELFERVKKQKSTPTSEESTTAAAESAAEPEKVEAKPCETPSPVDRAKIDFLLRAIRRPREAIPMKALEAISIDE
mmetsp:Transcript_45140/g.107372  ORF Transcript_45140/g.107372 Transcript_45140/m.107372 type:complete len:739 (+) Transcript_45140:76-2292(+)